MRGLLVTISSMVLSICCGCVCGDLGLIWTVQGQIVAADTQQPLSGEIIRIDLLREGTVFGGEYTIPVDLGPDGDFESQVYLGLSGSCGLIFLMPPPRPPLGDPPDEVEIVIRTSDGEEIRIMAPVPEENIVEITKVRGVPVSGLMDMGLIEVSAAGPGG